MFAVHQAQGSASATRAIAVAFLAGATHAAMASSAVAVPPASDDAVLVAAADFPRPSVEVSTSNLPRFDSFSGAPRMASRLDITLMPRRGSGVGLVMGVTNSRPYDIPAVPGLAANLATFDLGVHWRYTLDSNYRFDVTAYRRMPNSDAISLIESREPSYGARLEMRVASRYTQRKGFVADRGFVGVQLESGARLTVKRSGGVPMLYYRNTF